MKIRSSFVSNSSSCSFIIKNISSEPKTLRDFVLENTRLFYDFCERYDYKEDEHFSLGKMVDDSIKPMYDKTFEPDVEEICSFGDEDGTTLGHVFDYMLRDGGVSKSFEWRFHEYQR